MLVSALAKVKRSSIAGISCCCASLHAKRYRVLILMSVDTSEFVTGTVDTAFPVSSAGRLCTQLTSTILCTTHTMSARKETWWEGEAREEGCPCSFCCAPDRR